MQTVSRLVEAGLKVWEIEGTEWKLATRNSRKGEKRALQCELIFSWFLFILQILRFDRARPSDYAKRKTKAPNAAANLVLDRSSPGACLSRLNA